MEPGGNMPGTEEMSSKGGNAGTSSSWPDIYTQGTLNHFNWVTTFPALAEHWPRSQITTSPLSSVPRQALVNQNISSANKDANKQTVTEL